MNCSLGNEEKQISKPIQIPAPYPNSRLKTSNFYPNNSPNGFMNRVQRRFKTWSQTPKEDKDSKE